jgi:hypothetical protein
LAQAAERDTANAAWQRRRSSVLLLLQLLLSSHLRKVLVKQMSVAHIVQRFLWWVCSLQKNDSGSSAHGSPGSSNVLWCGAAAAAAGWSDQPAV